MSPGGHQKSGHYLWKTGHVQGTLVLDCDPRTTSEEAITCSNIFTWDLVRAGESQGPSLHCAAFWIPQSLSPLPSSTAMTLQVDEGQNGEIRLGKEVALEGACSRGRECSGTLCIPGLLQVQHSGLNRFYVFSLLHFYW